MTDHVIASHILVMHEESDGQPAARTKDEARQKIEGLKAEIDGGADFGDVAREHSECPSGRDGGALGGFGRGEMVPEFEEAAFALDIGKVSGVVETDFGFHLIRRSG